MEQYSRFIFTPEQSRALLTTLNAPKEQIEAINATLKAPCSAEELAYGYTLSNASEKTGASRKRKGKMGKWVKVPKKDIIIGDSPPDFSKRKKCKHAHEQDKSIARADDAAAWLTDLASLEQRQGSEAALGSGISGLEDAGANGMTYKKQSRKKKKAHKEAKDRNDKAFADALSGRKSPPPFDKVASWAVDPPAGPPSQAGSRGFGHDRGGVGEVVGGDMQGDNLRGSQNPVSQVEGQDAWDKDGGIALADDDDAAAWDQGRDFNAVDDPFGDTTQQWGQKDDAQVVDELGLEQGQVNVEHSDCSEGARKSRSKGSGASKHEPARNSHNEDGHLGTIPEDQAWHGSADGKPPGTSATVSLHQSQRTSRCEGEQRKSKASRHEGSAKAGASRTSWKPPTVEAVPDTGSPGERIWSPPHSQRSHRSRSKQESQGLPDVRCGDHSNRSRQGAGFEAPIEQTRQSHGSHCSSRAGERSTKLARKSNESIHRSLSQHSVSHRRSSLRRDQNVSPKMNTGKQSDWQQHRDKLEGQSVGTRSGKKSLKPGSHRSDSPVSSGDSTKADVGVNDTPEMRGWKARSRKEATRGVYEGQKVVRLPYTGAEVEEKSPNEDGSEGEWGADNAGGGLWG